MVAETAATLVVDDVSDVVGADGGDEVDVGATGEGRPFGPT